MKKIEKAMLDAIRSGKAWASGNTMVTCERKDSGMRFSQVFLHGNHIADVWDGGLCGETYPNIETFRVWPTRTTVSRLRALGVPVSVRKGKVFIGSEQV